jgi:integrase
MRVSAAPTTLAHYVARWIPRVRARTRPRTIYLYEWLIARHLAPLLPKKLSAISRLDVQDVVLAMRKANLAPATIKQALTVLTMILGDAVDDELLARNVAHGIARKIKRQTVRPPTIYAPEQIALFLDTATTTHPELAPLFALCSRAGLRVGEARGLKADDVDFPRQQCRIVRSVRDNTRVGPTKSGRARVVELAPSVLRLLEPYRRRVGWCFPGRDRGTVISYTTVRMAMRAICDQARLPLGSPHALRHAYASGLVQAGVSLEFVRRSLGHQSIATTMLYAAHLPLPRPDVLDAM